MDTFQNAGLLVTHCGEFYIFPYCAYAKKKRKKERKIMSQVHKLIDSAYMYRLTTLVINNAHELRKESITFPSEII